MSSNKRGPGDGSHSGPGQKRPRSDKFRLRLLVSSRVAGSIIGKAGANIHKLRTENNATVRVPDCPGPERVMTIEAEEEDTLISVLEQSLPLMSEDAVKARPGRSSEHGHGSNPDAQLEVRMLIHQSQIGGIIGKQGYKIKEIRESSGASLKVYQTPAPQSTERIAAIQGTAEKIVSALKTILNILKENEMRGPEHLYDPLNFDGLYSQEYGGYGSEADVGMFGRMGGARGSQRGSGGSMRSGFDGPSAGFGGRSSSGGRFGNGGQRGGFGSGGGGGGGGGGGPRGGFGSGFRGGPDGFGSGGAKPLMMPNAMIDDEGEKETSQVTIPKDAAGAIIGPGGARIRKIRSDSRASISIDENVTGNNERIITINGTQKQIQMAQYLLQQCIREFGTPAQQHGFGGGGRF